MQALPLVDDLAALIPTLDLPDRPDCTQADGAQLPVVVINLAHRRDRWEAVSERAAAAGLTKLIQAPAVDGRRLPDATISALVGESSDRIKASPEGHLSLTPPAIGCFLSHLGIWRWIIEQDLPRVLVLEDDARPAGNFTLAGFREHYRQLSDREGLVFAGCMIMDGLAEEPQGAHIARLYYFNGTFAYLITPAMCRVLLRQLLPLRTHIDHQVSSVLIEQREVLKAYYASPHFFEPDWSLRSDCYVPLANEATADRQLEDLFKSHRARLLAEGRPLLARYRAA